MKPQPLSVEKILELLSIQLPPTAARAGWIIDARAVAAAKNELGITFPVRFRFISAKYRHGSHYAYKNLHVITLDQNKQILETNLTLWHELAHAAQSEMFERETGECQSKFFERWYKPLGATGTKAYYTTNPFEKDANEVAQIHSHIMLVREIR